MNILIIELINLFFAGLLAGLEVAVHYGFHPQTMALDEKPQIVLRQGVARSLRWIAPGFFLPMALSGIALTVMAGASAGLYFRLAAILAIIVWVMIRIVGTVPINSATIEWNPDAPPKDWKERIGKAERFHILGTWAAVLAFAFFVIALGLQLTASTVPYGAPAITPATPYGPAGSDQYMAAILACYPKSPTGAEDTPIPNNSVQYLKETSRMFINMPKDLYPQDLQSSWATVAGNATAGSVGGGFGESVAATPGCWSSYMDFEGSGEVDLRVKSVVEGAPDYFVRFIVSPV